MADFRPTNFMNIMPRFMLNQSFFPQVRFREFGPLSFDGLLGVKALEECSSELLVLGDADDMCHSVYQFHIT